MFEQWNRFFLSILILFDNIDASLDTIESIFFQRKVIFVLWQFQPYCYFLLLCCCCYGPNISLCDPLCDIILHASFFKYISNTAPNSQTLNWEDNRNIVYLSITKLAFRFYLTSVLLSHWLVYWKFEKCFI